MEYDREGSASVSKKHRKRRSAALADAAADGAGTPLHSTAVEKAREGSTSVLKKRRKHAAVTDTAPSLHTVETAGEVPISGKNSNCATAACESISPSTTSMETNCGVSTSGVQENQDPPTGEMDIFRALQNKSTPIPRKIMLAYDFIISKGAFGDAKTKSVRFSRLVSFVGKCVQHILISFDGSKNTSDISDPALDCRCWIMLRYCIVTSSVTILPNLLRAFARVLKYALSSPSNDKEAAILCTDFFECLTCLFTSNFRVFYNASVELWITLAVEITSICRKILVADDISTDNVLFKLSVFLLEQFSSFLRFHPIPKNIFQDYVGSVLDDLLDILVLLHSKADDKRSEKVEPLLTVVEDVLSNGLFHPVHISGYYSLQNPTLDQNGTKVFKGSYHRHLFQKFKMAKSENKALLLSGFGYLFRLFVNRSIAGNSSGSEGLDVVTGKQEEVSGVQKDARVPLFEVFVQFMEPLIVECKRYAQSASADLDATKLVEAQCMIKAVNETLKCFLVEKIYARSEDTKGSHFNFLQEVYDTIILMAVKVYQYWSSALPEDCADIKKLLSLSAKELLVTTGHLLDIEHKLIGDELVKLWLMLFAFMSVNSSSRDVETCSSLDSEIIKLACHIIRVFSELRQVTYSIFALCKAGRILGVATDASPTQYPISVSSTLARRCLGSLAALMHSNVFQNTLSVSLKSMPERQSNGCIEELKVDILDTLQWLKTSALVSDFDGSSRRKSAVSGFQLQAELLGRLLSELYATVLGLVAVTPSNSVLVGKSTERLMEAIRPILTSLVGSNAIDISELFLSLTGKHTIASKGTPHNKVLRIFGPSLSWILVFFFRLYISCRSLYRQSISLMPPDKAKEQSLLIGDALLECTGTKWMSLHMMMDECYFSWVVKPSCGLHVVIQYIRDALFTNKSLVNGSLICVLYDMVLQRLMDLNRLIKVFESLKKDEVNSYRLEAVELTSFVTQFAWSLLSEKKCCGKTNDIDDSANFTDDRVHTEIWQRLCENFDIWCLHSSKSDLKSFISDIVTHCLIHEKICLNVSENLITGKSCSTLPHISRKLVGDASFHNQAVLSKLIGSMLSCSLKKLSLDVEITCTGDANLGTLPGVAEIIALLDKEWVISKEDQFTCPTPSSSEAYGTFMDCENLLNLLCKTPFIHMKAKSFLQCATYIFRLEWLVLMSLSKGRCEFFDCSNTGILRLLLSCRRALRYLVTALCEQHPEVKCSRTLAKLFGKKSSVYWIWKSSFKLVSLMNMLFGECSDLVKNIAIPFVHHTSHIFLILGNMCSVTCSLDPSEVSSVDVSINGGSLDKVGKCADSDECTSLHMEAVSEVLEGQARDLVLAVRGRAWDVDKSVWNKILCTASCIQGFIWGCVSALDSTDCSPDEKYISRLQKHIIVYESFINGCLYILLLDHKDEKIALDSINLPSAVEYGDLDPVLNNSLNNSMLTCSDVVDQLIDNTDRVGDLKIVRSRKSDRRTEVPKIHLSNLDSLNVSLLENLINGDNILTAFTLRELSSAAAAICKYRSLPICRRNNLPFKSNRFRMFLENLLVYTCCTVLQKTADVLSLPDNFSFLWIEGVLKYVEVIGCYCTSGYRNVAEETLSKLVNASLRALGKCILIQGKNATLSAAEIGLPFKVSNFQKGSAYNVQCNDERMCNHLCSFKTRIWMLLTNFIQGPNLASFIQIIERAVSGADQGIDGTCDVSIGAIDGGKVSSIVAAGIECLYLVLESFPGRRVPKVLKKNISSLLSSIFNIIAHLQSPLVFYTKELSHGDMELHQDAGAAVLMCVEVLIEIARHSFRLGASHVSQFFHVPVSLFKDFHFTSQIAVRSAAFNSFKGTQETQRLTIDHQYLVNLYAACCKLIYTVLRRTSKNGQVSDVEGCLHELQNSTSVLLRCFEYANYKVPQTNGKPAWDLQEATLCATFFRRIYEEMRKQKEVLGKHAFYFLGTYISIHSGSGPVQTGIRREIDETLRPGVYSLIDICSQDDFQRLHTYFGEGPCRGTLATLIHDYELYYQYKGKS